jgi:hypothetical protein
MMLLSTSIRTFIKKLYKKLFVKKTKTIQVEVPNTCGCRKDKDFLICSTIDFLERNIKIIEHE